MFEYIEKLRGKSEKTKKRIAFFGALGFSVVILGIWLSVVYPQIKNPEVVEKVQTGGPSPLSALGDNIYDGFSSVRGAFGGFKETFDTFTEEMEQFENSTSSTEYTVEGGAYATTTVAQ